MVDPKNSLRRVIDERFTGVGSTGRSEMDLCARINGVRRRWDVLQHPFYVRWESGELTRAELAFYAGEYRHAVVALARAASVAGDAEHAREEEDHISLWDDFAESLDAPLYREPTAETQACAEAWAMNERFEALAVLYAVESAQPAISQTKLKGLVQHYGFDADGRSTGYFRLHSERDLEHAAMAREALAAAPAADQEALVVVAESALAANWRLLDGVERAA